MTASISIPVSSLASAYSWKVGSNSTRGLVVEHRAGGFSSTTSVFVGKDGWCVFRDGRKVVVGMYFDEIIQIED